MFLNVQLRSIGANEELKRAYATCEARTCFLVGVIIQEKVDKNTINLLNGFYSTIFESISVKVWRVKFT